MSKRPEKRLYKVENIHKYRGNCDRVTMRSSWEYAVAKFLDHNDNVLWWSSEETVVPYVCATDGRTHRYYIDFTVAMRNGTIMMIEVKPGSQTRPPKMPRSKRITKGYSEAMQTWYKNVSKWDAAQKYAKARGWVFYIWTEVEMRKAGIRFIG